MAAVQAATIAILLGREGGGGRWPRRMAGPGPGNAASGRPRGSRGCGSPVPDSSILCRTYPDQAGITRKDHLSAWSRPGQTPGFSPGSWLGGGTAPGWRGAWRKRDGEGIQQERDKGVVPAQRHQLPHSGVTEKPLGLVVDRKSVV